MRQANTPACLIFFLQGGDSSLLVWPAGPGGIVWRIVLGNTCHHRHWAIALLDCITLAVVDSAAPRSLISQWDSATLKGIRDASLGAPMIASRALAIVRTCVYDAWAAYDERAVGTQLRGASQRLVNERTQANKERAISYAAYRVLTEVLPVDTSSVHAPLMKELGYGHLLGWRLEGQLQLGQGGYRTNDFPNRAADLRWDPQNQDK